MDYSKYYEARDIVKTIISKDMLGPLSEDEIINDYPVSYYLVGKLYPQDCRMTADRSSAEDIGNTEEEQTVALDEGRVPASMGLSFALKNDSTKFAISAKAALYKDIEEVDKDTKKLLWKRSAVELDFQTVLVSDLKKQRKIEYLVDNELKLVIMLHKIYPDGGMSVTATLVNANKMSRRESRFWINQHTYFQPEIIIKGKTDFFSDIRKNVKLSVNKETLEMEMLYSKYKNYVTGHGCAARFRFDGENLIIQTTYLPEYELKQMMPRQNVSSRILSMKYLSRTDKNTLISELSEWLDEYKVWIEKLKERRISKEYIKSANDNINRCMTTYETIKKSIACFGDEKVYKSFIYANEVMFMQRKQTLSNRGIDVPDDQIRWYPFQLAFFLQEIVSFAVPSASERKNVDLLWFPTGGGKTEAYLGIAAFVIFLRRLRNGLSGAGVSIIMRYTLRLLTFQQFERASAMICACELLRKKYEIPGGEISIGLWAGQALTPNTIEMADKILNGYSDPDCESSNPKQLEKCPWCGKKLNYSCDNMAKRMHIKCENTRCAFTKGLPIYLIDEEIYKFRPSFLVATVDKFAQVVQREQTFSLFGKNTDCVPPELIIQDELHLISGPLGTITGIYEAAFKKLCTYNGIGAKVIASTATIKNAKEQINSLYAADFTQFPPQALDADDSYFAVKSTRDNKPARLYMGCMGTGTSAPMVMIRVMAATLYATRYLESLDYDEEIIDSFWTITSYFNTLRELGGAIIRVVDNVQDRFAYLKETKFKEQFSINGGQTRYDTYIELTSREKSENIGRIIQNDLVIKYTKEKTAMPIDFILASNMISVGIDISRLNTMLVVGQPKTTAEYIQATSRVGRETPGFVFTMYNYMRSRDKSYFEQFSQYHEAFYKYVEATSVTPFAERARDRALQTLYIILCRYYIDILSDEEGAGRYNRNIPGLKEVRDYIYEYVSRVDPDELENVAEDIEDIELEWEALATKNPGMTYRKRPYKDNQYLFKDDFEEDSRFRIMNSMRSVETSVQVVTRSNMAFRIKPKSTTDKKENFKPKIVGEIRKSQSITTYGPGSLIDFPRMSAIVDGIDNWENSLGRTNFDKMKIHERNLEKILGKKYFIQPQMIQSKNFINGINARRFPEYCYCPECGALDKYYRLEKKEINTTDYNREVYCGICFQSKNRKVKLIPSRFVIACKCGHIDEFPYDWWVHRNKGQCGKSKLTISISKTTNSLEGIIIKCQCGAEENLGGIMDVGALYQRRCYGWMPWLGRSDDNKSWYTDLPQGEYCENELRVLQRGANNVYYPKIVSALTIPPYSSRIQRILASDLEMLSAECEKPEALKRANLEYYFESNATRLKCNFEQFLHELDYAMGNVNQGITRIRDLVEGEYDALCDEDCPDADFLTIESEVPMEFSKYIDQIKIVGRLREVQVLQGFTRILHEDAMIAPLSKKPLLWLPGNELYGEGIFIRLNEEQVKTWEKKNQKRYAPLVKRANNNFFSATKVSSQNVRYILLHTLAHLIIRELTTQCGYTSASLKEKIYSSEGEEKEMCGILIYTASSDSDGSLGGLARQGVTEKLRDILLTMLEEASWCSNDPICIDSTSQGYASLNYAACHACGLLPETSCECGNVLLDRGAIIGTAEDTSLGYFAEFME